MNFDIDAVLKDMALAVQNTVKDKREEIREYGKRMLEDQKDDFAQLAEARISGALTEEEFQKEIEREKRVLAAEMLTLEIMTKAAAQAAINAAIDVFLRAVKAAL
jgi:hypothetical protein